jgi:hypothetical protein
MTSRTLTIGLASFLATPFLSTTLQDPGAAADRTELILDERFDANHTFESVKYFAQF